MRSLASQTHPTQPESNVCHVYAGLVHVRTGTQRMVVENIYRDSEEARWNVDVWSRARTLAEARPLLKKVCSRFVGLVVWTFAIVSCFEYDGVIALVDGSMGQVR